MKDYKLKITKETDCLHIERFEKTVDGVKLYACIDCGHLFLKEFINKIILYIVENAFGSIFHLIREKNNEIYKDKKQEKSKYYLERVLREFEGKKMDVKMAIPSFFMPSKQSIEESLSNSLNAFTSLDKNTFNSGNSFTITITYENK